MSSYPLLEKKGLPIHTELNEYLDVYQTKPLSIDGRLESLPKTGAAEWSSYTTSSKLFGSFGDLAAKIILGCVQKEGQGIYCQINASIYE